MGPKNVVLKEEQQLKQIAAPEAAQVSDPRTQILGTDSFKKPPKGVDGHGDSGPRPTAAPAEPP